MWPWRRRDFGRAASCLARTGLACPSQNGAAGGVAITIDDGQDPDVTPHLLSQLAEYRAQATFFCVGVRVERYADLAREIVTRGHHIENHSQRHRHNFSLMARAA